MGTSHFHQIPGLMRYVEALKPASILEIGSGIGKWGFLCRDRLEFFEGRYDKQSWRTLIYGIEMCAAYRNPIWEYCYDRMWVGDVLGLIGIAPAVDLVLMADVIEHIPKNHGRELLAKVQTKARHLLISTPVRFFTGECNDNSPGAAHVSFWDRMDFSEYSYVTEERGSTRFFLVDLHSAGGAVAVESAERYPFSAILRALVLKIAHKLRIPTGRFVAPHRVSQKLSADK